MGKWVRIYKASWLIVIVLFIVFMIAYQLGAKKIYIRGINFQMPVGGSYQLYKINDSLAIQVTKDGFQSVLEYEKTKGLETLAGKYRVNGERVFMVTADYMKGDYIYSSFPQGNTTIVNIQTGEVVGKAAEEGVIISDIGELPEYKSRNLTAEEGYLLKIDKIKSNFDELSTFQEGIYTIILAFMLIVIIMLLLGIPILLKRVVNINK